MDNGAMWGAILICYVVPYAGWQIARQVRGAPEDEAAQTRIGMAWFGGMVLLLLGWYSGFHAPSALVLLTPFALLLIQPLRSRIAAALRSRIARLWLAGSATWVLATIAWDLVFPYSIENPGRLAVLPPLVALAGGAAFAWARR